MSKFAKLFERGGDQVLIMSSVNDDGAPCLKYLTVTNGCEVSTQLNFAEDDWDKADLALANANEESAFELRDYMVKEFWGGV